MDLRMFYQKIKGVEAGIADDPAVVVSNDTPDGGKSGVRTEVTRSQAARLIVEGRARLATSDEASEYRAAQKDGRDRAEHESSSRRVQFALVSDQDLKGIRSTGKKA